MSDYPIVGGEFDVQAMEEQALSARKAKVDAEKTRAFVLEHLSELLGKTMPMDIASVQNLPGHSCLIVNDHYLYSYREAEELIKSLGVANVGTHP